MNDEFQKHQYSLEKIDRSAEHRDKAIEKRVAYDAEAERIAGENERALAKLQQDIAIENRNLDIQFRNYQDGQQVRLESLQTTIKQHDDFFRFFWELEKDVLNMEIRLTELFVAGDIQQGQTRLEQSHEIQMEGERRETLILQNELAKDKYEFEKRLDVELAGQSAQADSDKAKSTIEKLKREGKL